MTEATGWQENRTPSNHSEDTVLLSTERRGDKNVSNPGNIRSALVMLLK